MRIEAQGIPQRDSSHYLGSIFRNDGDIDKDVKHRIKTRWSKWRLSSRVVCDPRMPTRLKKKFYRTTIRSALTYG